MKYQLVTEEARLAQLIPLYHQLWETRDVAERSRVVSELKKVLDVHAETFKEMRALIGECLARSRKQLWINKAGFKVGDTVNYCGREGIIQSFTGHLEQDAQLVFTDGQKPRSGPRSVYMIKPIGREVDLKAFLESLPVSMYISRKED